MSIYASVIIPTHDRTSTLAATVRSIQRQTVRDIEIIIVGDGATADVAAGARALAAEDERIRFVEFEKAPGSGGANRDRAVRELARSERVFYTDDDDLWLSRHVETIGPHLDHFDVVDTLPVSATCCGRLALACVNSGHPRTRALLDAGKLKLMYDTHLAHRRSTYLRLGNPWSLSTGGDVVRRMLGTFASDPDVSWRTLPVATAVSLHGGARATYSAAERRDEIARWAQDLEGVTPEQLTADAHPAWQFFFCLNLVPPESPSLEDYLRELGMAVPAAGDRPAEAPLLALPLGDAGLRELRTVFDLHRGAVVGEADVVAAVPYLLDEVTISVGSWAFLRRALGGFALGRSRGLVKRLPRDSARAAELLAIFDGYLMMWARRLDEAHAIARRLLRETVLARHEAEILLGEVELARGNGDEGLDFLRRAAERENRPSTIAVRLASALVGEGRAEEARACLDRIETRIGGMPAVTRLREQLAGLEAARV